MGKKSQLDFFQCSYEVLNQLQDFRRIAEPLRKTDGPIRSANWGPLEPLFERLCEVLGKAGNMLTCIPDEKSPTKEWIYSLGKITCKAREAIDAKSGGYAFLEGDLDDLLNPKAIELGVRDEIKCIFRKTNDPLAVFYSNTAASSKVRKKRSTNNGDAQLKQIAALTKHHKYAKDSCLNQNPIGNNELAEIAGVSRSTASVFFKQQFGSHSDYVVYCKDATSLAYQIKRLRGEFTPAEERRHYKEAQDIAVQIAVQKAHAEHEDE